MLYYNCGYIAGVMFGVSACWPAMEMEDKKITTGWDVPFNT
jgi:hypothetical protein